MARIGCLESPQKPVLNYTNIINQTEMATDIVRPKASSTFKTPNKMGLRMQEKGKTARKGE